MKLQTFIVSISSYLFGPWAFGAHGFSITCIKCWLHMTIMTAVSIAWQLASWQCANPNCVGRDHSSVLLLQTSDRPSRELMMAENWIIDASYSLLVNSRLLLFILINLRIAKYSHTYTCLYSTYSLSSWSLYLLDWNCNQLRLSGAHDDNTFSITRVY
jgi:hypothetical protein